MTAFRKNREQGIALVLVLWIVALLAILAVNFVHESGTQAKIALNDYEHARARALADTGVSLAIVGMLDRNSEVPQRLDGSLQQTAYNGGTIRLRLQDEAGKIDLNGAPVLVISNLLQFLLGDDDSENSAGFAASLTAWKQHRLALWAGPEDAPTVPTIGPFLTVDELLQVPGITQSLFDRVAPFVTVVTRSPGIDPLSAAREVLMSLPGADIGEVNAYIAARQAYGPDPALLPHLSGLDRYLVHSPSAENVSIVSEGEFSPRVRFVREATVSLVALEGERFHFLRWRQGTAE